MEIVMPVLKSLAFTALPKSANDPVLARRAKVVDRLEEQKRLLDDPNLVRTVQRSALVDGERKPRHQGAAGPAFVSLRQAKPHHGIGRAWDKGRRYRVPCRRTADRSI